MELPFDEFVSRKVAAVDVERAFWASSEQSEDPRTDPPTPGEAGAWRDH